MSAYYIGSLHKLYQSIYLNETIIAYSIKQSTNLLYMHMYVYCDEAIIYEITLLY